MPRQFLLHLYKSIVLVCFIIAVSACRKYDSTILKTDGKDTISVNTNTGGSGNINADPNNTAAILSAKIEVKNNMGKLASDENCTINAKDEIITILPTIDAVKKLAVTFTTKTTGTAVKVNDTLQVSGITVTDYSKAVTYNLSGTLHGCCAWHKTRIVVKVQERWAAIKDKEVKQIFADIDETAQYLKLSQRQNFTKWPILNTYVYPNAVITGNYDSEVAYFKSFLTQRINWINNNMAY